MPWNCASSCKPSRLLGAQQFTSHEFTKSSMILYDTLCHYARCQKPCNFGVFSTYRYCNICNYPNWLFGLQSAQAKFKGSKVLEMVRQFHPISRFPERQQIHFATINGTAWDSKFKPRPVNGARAVAGHFSKTMPKVRSKCPGSSWKEQWIGRDTIDGLSLDWICCEKSTTNHGVFTSKYRVFL